MPLTITRACGARANSAAVVAASSDLVAVHESAHANSAAASDLAPAAASAHASVAASGAAIQRQHCVCCFCSCCCLAFVRQDPAQRVPCVGGVVVRRCCAE